MSPNPILLYHANLKLRSSAASLFTVVVVQPSRSSSFPMSLIPTAAKDRLPKGYTYPLGAEAISTALEGIPALEDSRIWFSWRDEYWASAWRQKIASLGEVNLLKIEKACFGDGREIRVYAVPSEYSESARAHVLSEFLRVRNALISGGGSARVSVTMILSESAQNTRLKDRSCGDGF
jgi:hypothetical protein